MEMSYPDEYGVKDSWEKDYTKGDPYKVRGSWNKDYYNIDWDD